MNRTLFMGPWGWIWAAATLGGLLVLGEGCRKKEAPTPSGVPVEARAEGSLSPAVTSAPAGAQAVPAKATQAQTPATGRTSGAETAVNKIETNTANQAQVLIDSARKLMAEGKWQEALTKFTELARVNPTNFTEEQISSLMNIKEDLEKQVK